MHLNECFDKVSAFSVAECIASDWFVKTKTIFYIPEDAYAGYSYLYDESGRMGSDNFGQQQYHSSNPGPHRRHHAFVRAEEISGLHQHHYHYNYHHYKSIIMQSNGDVDEKLSQPFSNITSALLPPEVNYYHTFFTALDSQQTTAPITVPYIHPELGLPVPPLQLPWFFGALCFSFTFGGIMMLYWTPRWTKHGGGCVNGTYQRHWFPYQTFAWILILLQGPCSFFADYLHMTNVSYWHMVDRWLACFNMAFKLGELMCMYRFTRPVIFASYVGCTATAVVSFLKSQHAQSSLDTDGFIFWHNCWHCFPITLIVVCWFENVLNRSWGEYYHFKDC